MAVSKTIRKARSDTNQQFQDFFRNSQVSQERKDEWEQAIARAGSGTPSLRFPLYEHLYNFNVLAQRLVDTLQEIAGTPGLKGDILPHHQALIQYVRASVSGDIVGSMAGIELTEAWLFESLHRAEERKLLDPDDVRLHARKRKTERNKQDHSPRVQVLDKRLSPGKRVTTRRKSGGSP